MVVFLPCRGAVFMGDIPLATVWWWCTTPAPTAFAPRKFGAFRELLLIMDFLPKIVGEAPPREPPPKLDWKPLSAYGSCAVGLPSLPALVGEFDSSKSETHFFLVRSNICKSFNSRVISYIPPNNIKYWPSNTSHEWPLLGMGTFPSCLISCQTLVEMSKRQRSLSFRLSSPRPPKTYRED